MFSKRLNIEFEPNQLSILFNAKIAKGEKIFDLTSSNPTKLNFSYEEKLILKNFIDEQSLVYNPDPKGLITARETVKEYYKSLGKKVNVEDIFITPSTSEAYSFLFKLLLDPDDEVLIPQPCYPLFEYLAMLDSGNVIYYPLLYEHKAGWRPDFKGLQANITGKTKSIILINPNNPTGSYIKSDDYFRFVDICRKNKIALISDEVFSDYDIEKNDDILRTIIGEKSYLNFILNGYSKMLGLPQMKFGWIVIEGEEEIKSEAIKRLEVIADTYLSVSTVIQNASSKLFITKNNIQTQIRGRIKTNYEMLQSKLLLNPDIRLLKCEGGWSAVISFGNLLISEDKFVYGLLEKKNVLIHPGYYYDFIEEGFAVISLLTETHILEEGIDRLLSIYD
ncbi:MAG: pyridoxal phosphate-dependent aminotransferase [Ignavibacteria bacterium]|nr:pyridoxal phosphate-dependent aminotransferase [Ignavibacteria bacterium]